MPTCGREHRFTRAVFDLSIGDGHSGDRITGTIWHVQSFICMSVRNADKMTHLMKQNASHCLWILRIEAGHHNILGRAKSTNKSKSTSIAE